MHDLHGEPREKLQTRAYHVWILYFSTILPRIWNISDIISDLL